MSLYTPLTGIIVRITRPDAARNLLGCTLTMTLQSQEQGLVNVTVTSSTYVLNSRKLNTGDRVTCFYSSNAPVPLIFPPLYRAVAVAHTSRNQTAALDIFNTSLTNSDNTLKLNLTGSTNITMPNGQPFTGYLAGKVLLVLYGAVTRSIPAQTTPEQVIVFCREP